MHMKDSRTSRLVDLPPFQEIIDLVVGDAIGLFIRTKRREVLEIVGWNLVNQFRRRAEMRRQGADPAFVQTGEREYVGGAVAELGEEAHQRLRRVIGADDQSTPGAGE